MKTTLHPPRKKVKKNCTKMQHPGTRLVPLLLKRKGEMDQIFYAPVCAGCGQPILDPQSANVVTVGWDFRQPVPLTETDGAKYFTLPADAAFVFHWGGTIQAANHGRALRAFSRTTSAAVLKGESRFSKGQLANGKQ
jgi:hypothetical protein